MTFIRSVDSSQVGVVAIILLFVLGCSESRQISQEEVEIIEGTKKIAPESGAGIREYSYHNGATRERVHWEEGSIVEIEYFDLSGQLLHRATPVGRRGLVLELGPDGEVLAITEVKDFVRDGTRFVLRDHCITELQTWDYGKLTASVTLEND